jgi:hypothetical protein
VSNWLANFGNCVTQSSFSLPFPPFPLHFLCYLCADTSRIGWRRFPPSPPPPILPGSSISCLSLFHVLVIVSTQSYPTLSLSSHQLRSPFSLNSRKYGKRNDAPACRARNVRFRRHSRGPLRNFHLLCKHPVAYRFMSVMSIFLSLVATLLSTQMRCLSKTERVIWTIRANVATDIITILGSIVPILAPICVEAEKFNICAFISVVVPSHLSRSYLRLDFICSFYC